MKFEALDNIVCDIPDNNNNVPESPCTMSTSTTKITPGTTHNTMTRTNLEKSFQIGLTNRTRNLLIKRPQCDPLDHRGHLSMYCDNVTAAVK